MQLRRIVADFKQPDLVAYDFVYSDAGPHAEEIDEWFVYQFWQWVRLNAAQRAFEWHWQHEHRQTRGWDDSDPNTQREFVEEALESIKSADSALRAPAIGRLTYLVLGRWADTASSLNADPRSKSSASPTQLAAMKTGVMLLTAVGGVEAIWEALRKTFEFFW
jgi:hypothetical protein